MKMIANTIVDMNKNFSGPLFLRLPETPLDIVDRFRVDAGVWSKTARHSKIDTITWMYFKISILKLLFNKKYWV